MSARARFGARSLSLVCGLLACAASVQSQGDADVSRVVEALALVNGSVIAEIGAGDGELTLALARHVGDGGHVFTTELGDGHVRALRAAVSKSGLSQIEVLEAQAASTNLGTGCCDAIVMRDVYHHFGDPAAMNASLLASLKAGGRLAILDFGPPPGQESETPAGRSKDGHHGIGRQTVSRELAAAGFDVVSTDSLNDRRFIVVARKP